MKNFIVLILFSTLVGPTFAHDEGHGPKLADSGRFGGLVASVVKLSDAKLGAKAEMIYKAELVRSTDGPVRVYLYDKTMKALPLDKYRAEVKGIMSFKYKGKYQNESFKLKKENQSFVGKMPTVKVKPYNLDFQMSEGTTDLLTAFDNLD